MVQSGALKGSIFSNPQLRLGILVLRALDALCQVGMCHSYPLPHTQGLGGLQECLEMGKGPKNWRVGVSRAWGQPRRAPAWLQGH